MLTKGADPLDAVVMRASSPRRGSTPTGPIGRTRRAARTRKASFSSTRAACTRPTAKKRAGSRRWRDPRTSRDACGGGPQKAVMDYTDHTMLVGAGAKKFRRREMGFKDAEPP